MTKIVKLFEVHNKLLKDNMMQLCEDFSRLDKNFFMGEGPVGLKLRRLLGTTNGQNMDWPIFSTE